MNDEPTTQPFSEDDDKPATKADVRAVADDLDKLAQATSTTFDKMDSKIESLKSGQAAILELVKGIDRQLKEWKHIPAKVERLHQRVFGTHEK